MFEKKGFLKYDKVAAALPATTPLHSWPLYPLPSPACCQLYIKCKDIKNSKQWVVLHGMSALVGRKPDAIEEGFLDPMDVGTADVRARLTDRPPRAASSPPRRAHCASP